MVAQVSFSPLSNDLILEGAEPPAVLGLVAGEDDRGVVCLVVGIDDPLERQRAPAHSRGLGFCSKMSAAGAKQRQHENA